jgi:hypothetical protein
LENPGIADSVKTRLRQAAAQTNHLSLRWLELAALARLVQICQEKERLLCGENGGSQG